LDDLRFSYAQKLLTLTALSIKEVQYRSGFLDYANFARRFKEKQGLSPTEYRKKHRVS
jgi:transcriptional regulator GlxA family with amidase domain